MEPTTWEEAAQDVATFVQEEYLHLFHQSQDGIAQLAARTVESLADMEFGGPGLEKIGGWAESQLLGLAVTGLNGYKLATKTDPAEALPFIVATVIRKQADYGHQNVARFGLTGLVVRMSDKVARLQNLLTREADAANEPLTDSWLDLVGYALVALMWLRGTFLLPLSGDA